MTTADLIKELQAEDPSGTREVIIQIDPAGNGYRKCRGADGNATYEMDGHFVETSREHLTDELRKQGFTEEDVRPGKPAIILYP